MNSSGKKAIFSKEKVKNAPVTPGVYIFWNKSGTPIYVGKSINLKSRLTQYLGKNLAPKTTQMVAEANTYSVIRVTSELESLLLEARLVRRLWPKYNSQLKDDKHPLYIKITKALYPIVVTGRLKDIGDKAFFYGPFPHSGNVKSVLKMLRSIFPYAQHKIGKSPCIYSQMGLCDPCPNQIEMLPEGAEKLNLRKKYLSNIRSIKSILSGNIKSVSISLQRKMNTLSKNEHFEEALIIRNKLDRLKYITQPVNPLAGFIENPNLVDDIYDKEARHLSNILNKYMTIAESLERIECYDVAHISGSYSAASMVTFFKGIPDKTLYRHFKIKKMAGGNDIASLKEVIQRRLRHIKDWGKPNLVVVDGGKAQVATFWEELKGYGIPLTGIAKRYETLVIPVLQQEELIFKEIVLKGPALALLQRLRNEAHRFARRYHHKLIQKTLLSKV